MNQTWENDKKPNFGPDFDPNLVPKNFVCFLPPLDVRHFWSYHDMQFQGKLMNQIWENNKKPSFKPNFGPSGPNPSRQIFFFESLASSVTRYYG